MDLEIQLSIVKNFQKQVKTLRLMIDDSAYTNNQILKQIKLTEKDIKSIEKGIFP